MLETFRPCWDLRCSNHFGCRGLGDVGIVGDCRGNCEVGIVLPWADFVMFESFGLCGLGDAGNISPMLGFAMISYRFGCRGLGDVGIVGDCRGN
jgi:hypothetical protein